MRRAHAKSPEQLELIEEWTALGYFHLGHVTFDAERACVVVPYHQHDEAADVESRRRTLRDRLRLRSGDAYAPRRRWFW